MGEGQYRMSDKKENEERRSKNEDEETKWMREYTHKVKSNCKIE